VNELDLSSALDMGQSALPRCVRISSDDVGLTAQTCLTAK
jgi:hypothetical protein